VSLSVGIVGLPNVGKSTLFNALLKKQQALAANYPFATIEPNVGIVPVPDQRLSFLAETIAAGKTKLQITNSKQAQNSNVQFQNKDNWPPVVPATVEFLDIAGLVKGAHEGDRLGNQFLAHIREASVIAFVVRAFRDENVVETGTQDLGDDLKTVQTELMMADLISLEKQREPKGAVSREDGLRWQAMQKIKTVLEAGELASKAILTDDESKAAKSLFLLTAKPAIYVVNVGESQIMEEGLRMMDLMATFANKLEVKVEDVVVISAKVEAELAALAEEEQKEYLKEMGLEQSSLERLISAAYQKLNLMSFLTAGEKEVRAWTITKGTTAVKAAGTIHTDFEKKFIKADVANWEKFVEIGGWKEAREKGLVRSEGRDYVMKDGDVVEFKVGN
jgi:ribosome-binding ATPase